MALQEEGEDAFYNFFLFLIPDAIWSRDDLRRLWRLQKRSESGKQLFSAPAVCGQVVVDEMDRYAQIVQFDQGFEKVVLLLSLGHSGQVLILSNAAHASLCSPTC